MVGNIYAALGLSLLLTLVLELGFCLVCGVRGRHDLLLVAAANGLTNPAVVFTNAVLRTYLVCYGWWCVAVLEVLAVVVEWLVFKYCADEIPRPFFLSLGANAFSYSCGLVLGLLV
ncbi:MAG: hypothetical protein LBM18_02680 [Oscillospiraceae bacterium]|jgi:hypothetical protein|nr:hypothetical protein [Oscillospiraceae bacterium]